MLILSGAVKINVQLWQDFVIVGTDEESKEREYFVIVCVKHDSDFFQRTVS